MLKTRSKNLVISTVGDNSQHKRWINSPNYDTFLVYYGNQKGYENESTYYKRAQGYKYHLVKDILDENDWIYDYDYVWLPDDDIAANSQSIGQLFEFMTIYNLWIAQPSIFGWHGTPVNLPQFDSILRYTNWIEIMCPCFSSYALKICKDSFKENKSGWSIEGIWNVLLNHPRDKFAIIDDVNVIHTRQVLTGDTHQNKPAGFAYQEGVDVCNKWNLVEEYKKDIPHGKLIDCEIKYFVEYQKIKKHVTQGIYPNGNLMKLICQSYSNLDDL